MLSPAQLALLDALVRRKLLVCVGPLVSMAAGLAGPRDLVELCRERLASKGASAPTLADASGVAEALERAEALLGSAPFVRLVREAWEPLVPVPEVARALVGLSPGLNGLITTNLDRLLERAFEGRWFAVDEAAPDVAKRTQVIFKVRGTIDRPTGWMLTARQQANVAERRIDPLARKLIDHGAAGVVPARRPRELDDEATADPEGAGLRDAAYGMLTDADARTGHFAAGVWLTRVGESDAVILGDHFLRGGDPEQAARHFVAAADQAFLRHEFDAVLQLVARGSEHAPPGEARGRLLLRRAEVHAVAGDHHDAAEAATAALADLPPNSPRWYSAVGEAAQASARLGDLARVGTLIDRLSDLQPTATGGGEHFLGLIRAAVPLAAAAAVTTAATLLENIVRVTARTAATDPGALGAMHSARALQAIARGAVGTVFKEMEAAAIAFERAGSVRNSLELFGGAGFFSLELGCRERGEEILRRTIRRSREVGLEHLCAVASHNLGRRVGEAGDIEGGLALERAALASFELHENRRMRGLTLSHIAWILLVAGRLDEAAAHIEEALPHLQDHPASRIIALATRAQIYLRRGAIDAALEDARAAHDGLRSLDRVQEGESLIRLTWAEALSAAGQTEEAAEALASAARSLDERAGMIEQDHLRASFLSLPENQRITQFARGLRLGSG